VLVGIRFNEMTIRYIHKVYKQATPQEIHAGVEWYPSALACCKKLATEVRLPVHTVVGVVAALSPNNRWASNIPNARDLITGYQAGKRPEDIRVGTYHAMKAKAWSILEATPDYGGVLVLLNGKKITAFYENIMGNDKCTIDGHAKNIYYGKRERVKDNGSIGVKEYRTIVEAYAKVAKMYNLKTHEMQAITWITWRRIHNIT